MLLSLRLSCIYVSRLPSRVGSRFPKTPPWRKTLSFAPNPTSNRPSSRRPSPCYDTHPPHHSLLLGLLLSQHAGQDHHDVKRDEQHLRAQQERPLHWRRHAGVEEADFVEVPGGRVGTHYRAVSDWLHGPYWLCHQLVFVLIRHNRVVTPLRRGRQIGYIARTILAVIDWCLCSYALVGLSLHSAGGVRLVTLQGPYWLSSTGVLNAKEREKWCQPCQMR
jgi:hypothetical protein